MCELFALSSSLPTDVKFSLSEFSTHGGLKGPHKDGWGIAYYKNTDALIIKEAHSASTSECLNFIKNHSLHSKIIISHIRNATQGKVHLNNTQPFSRELGGRMHVFAHNGDLIRIESNKEIFHSIFHPIGQTDSEFAFCYLLHLIKDLWLQKGIPTIDERVNTVYKFAQQIKKLGPANFIYSDGELVFAHGHKRKHNNEHSFRPPGLRILKRECYIHANHPINITGLDISPTHTKQNVVLIASVPLSQEKWQCLDEGEMVIIKNGSIIRSIKYQL